MIWNIRYLSGNSASLVVALALDGEGDAIGSLRFNLKVCCLRKWGVVNIVSFKFNLASLGVFSFFLPFFPFPLLLFLYIYLFSLPLSQLNLPLLFLYEKETS